MSDFNSYAYTPNYHLPYPDESNENIDLIENLSKLAGAVDTTLKGDLVIKELTENLAITTGNTPSLDTGYYYTGEYHVSVNGSNMADLDGSIFYFSKTDIDFDFQLIKIWGSGLGFPYVVIDKLSGDDEINVIERAPLTLNQLVTSISSSSTNNQIPSAKCVYDIVGDIETALQTLNTGGGVE